MKKVDAKLLFIVIILLLTSVVSWNKYFKVYRQDDTVDIHKFPISIGAWNSQELIITDDEYEILETRNAFTRKYFIGDEQHAYLFIVYSERNRKVSHPPEICYTGGGVSVVDSRLDTIAVSSAELGLESNTVQEDVQIRANRLLLEKGDVQQIAFYWFKVGDTFTSNYWKQQFLIVLNTILGKPSSSALIRVSATVRNGDTDEADENIKSFSRTMLPVLIKYIP